MDHRESSHSADLSNYSDDFEEDELVDTSAKVLLSNAEGTPKHAKPNSILVSKTDPIQRKAKKQFNSTTVNVSRVKGINMSFNDWLVLPVTIFPIPVA